MRLGEALEIIARPAGDRCRNIQLLCGFMPLHLETFVKASIRLRFPEDGIRLPTGLFGDFEGNIQRASATPSDGCVVAIEWNDLDHRLGFRASAGWGSAILADVVSQVEAKCSRLEKHLSALGRVSPVVVVGPTLAMPPVTALPAEEATAFELDLTAILTGFKKRIRALQGIRLLSDNVLALNSPCGSRYDIKADLRTGFPYTVTHASEVANSAVRALFPASPKKGLITDLDQTLWKGILGDDGVEGVSWSLEAHSQIHALYQQLLGSLIDSGILVAVASKNDPDRALSALQRADLLLPMKGVFPVDASWGPKSEAIGRILKAWNVGQDSVVFVDDSPMELAEVADKYPGVLCLKFTPDDPAAVLALLKQLRVLFGKAEAGEEDRIRVQSLRAAAALEEERTNEAPGDFLARLDATVSIESADPSADRRAFELVNKTNQFNLNGRRYTEAEWQSYFDRPESFLLTISYEDRFGPLGRIAALGGYFEGDCCVVDMWVLSCRAFSRQVEFQVLRQLFRQSAASSIRFSFNPTDRNGPLQSFFAEFSPTLPPAGETLDLPREVFDRACPVLHHQIIEKWTTPKSSLLTVSN